jgi:hypothetical protein
VLCESPALTNWRNSDWSMPLNFLVAKTAKIGGRPVQFPARAALLGDDSGQRTARVGRLPPRVCGHVQELIQNRPCRIPGTCACRWRSASTWQVLVLRGWTETEFSWVVVATPEGQGCCLLQHCGRIGRAAGRRPTIRLRDVLHERQRPRSTRPTGSRSVSARRWSWWTRAWRRR